MKMKNPMLPVPGIFVFLFLFYTVARFRHMLLLLPLLMRLNGFDLIGVTTLFRAITPLHPHWRTSTLIHLPTNGCADQATLFKSDSEDKKQPFSVHQTIGGSFSFSTDSTLMLSLPTASGTRTTPSSIVFVSPFGDGAPLVLN